MKSVSAPIATSILLLTLAMTSEAAPPAALDAPTRIQAARNDCLARQKNPAQHAASLRGRDALMSTLSQQFCQDPGQFCRSFEKMLDQGGDPNFVNAACENGSIPRLLTANWDEPTPPSSASATNPFTSQFVQDAWRCAPVKRQGTDQFELDCLDVAMPFTCSDDRKTKFTSPAREAMLKAGAHFEKKGEVCAIVLTRPRNTRPVDFARLPEQIFKLGLADLKTRSTSRNLANSTAAPPAGAPRATPEPTAEALRREVDSFSMAMRGAYSPRRLAEAKKLFGIARAAVSSYLREIDAPRSIQDTMAQTEFLDVRPFFTNPDHRTPEDLLKILSISGLCRPAGSGPLGIMNAFNTDFEGSHQVALCPHVILHADFANPRELLLVLTHELGHTIDACSLGVLQLNFDPELAGPYCKESVLKTSNFLDATLARRPDEAEMNEFSNFALRIKGQGGVAECLGDRFVAANPQQQVRLIQSILAQEDCLAPADRCALRQLQPKGALQYCPIVPYLAQMRARFAPYFSQHRTFCPGLQTALTELSVTAMLGEANGARGIKQQVQVNEAFADYIAAGALPFALKNPALGTAVASAVLSDRRADFLTLATVACFEQRPGDDNTGSHPNRDYRISIFSDAPQVRRLMGCQQFDRRPAGQPSANGAFSCENRMNPKSPAASP